MLREIQKEIKKWSREECEFWYQRGLKARGTNLDYEGSTWIGYYAFHDAKEKHAHERDEGKSSR